MADPEADDDWLFEGLTDPGAVADRYDDWAESYDADLDAWSYRPPAVVAETVLARLPAATSVLDVGCGTGLVGRALRAAGYAGHLRGLDISRSSLRIAARSGTYDGLDAADLQQPLPVEDSSVDALVCVGVMTYLPDTEPVWREFARVVRSGGLVVLTQREDLWEPRGCQGVVERLSRDGVWSAPDVSGPSPYLPEAEGGLAGVGCCYVTTAVV